MVVLGTEYYLGRAPRPQSLVLHRMFSAPRLALCILQPKHLPLSDQGTVL